MEALRSMEQHKFIPDIHNACQTCGKGKRTKIHDGLTDQDIKQILDDLHRNFDVKEIEVNGELYRWPWHPHDENCRAY